MLLGQLGQVELACLDLVAVQLGNLAQVQVGLAVRLVGGLDGFGEGELVPVQLQPGDGDLVVVPVRVGDLGRFDRRLVLQCLGLLVEELDVLLAVVDGAGRGRAGVGGGAAGRVGGALRRGLGAATVTTVVVVAAARTALYPAALVAVIRTARLRVEIVPVDDVGHVLYLPNARSSLGAAAPVAVWTVGGAE